MSTEPDGTIERTPDGGVVRFDRTLPFPIGDVWSAITDPDRIADWWPPFAADITVDLRIGGQITFSWPDIELPDMQFTILELSAPNVLQHTHTSPGSSMRWELEATDAGTRLRATYVVPDLDQAVERGDVVGLHHSLDRLAPALDGSPQPWNNDAFARLQQAYAARG